MITFKNIDQNLYDPEGLKTDFRKTAKGKSGKEQVRKVKRNPEKYEKELERQLRTNTFTKATHQTETINEYSCKKTRELLKPTYLYEQPAHHALIRAIMPALMRGMYDLSCGSIPGRGPHYGKRFVEKWIRNDPKNCKYVSKFDIRHFFQSIPHRRLKKALKKKIRDRVILKKLFAVIDCCKQGVPIGFYTSQWFGNFYLTPLDHYIKEKLHVKKMIRYADDVVCFGRNKKILHEARRKIEQFLNEELGLKMKPDWQVFRFEYTGRDGKIHGRALDFMGFVFHRNRTTIRKSILNRIQKKVNKVKRKGKVTWKDAASLLSRIGYFTHTDTYNYYLDHVKPYIKVKALKQLISKHTRRERLKNGMDQKRRNSNRTPGGFRHHIKHDNRIPEKKPETGRKRESGRNKGTDLDLRRNGNEPGRIRQRTGGTCVAACTGNHAKQHGVDRKE